MPIERLRELFELWGVDDLPARTEIASGIDRSFEWFRRYDKIFARESRRAMMTSAQKIIRQIDALRTEVRHAPHAPQFPYSAASGARSQNESSSTDAVHRLAAPCFAEDACRL
jgi:hypothetical protein